MIQRQSGFTLLEVLITVTIIAILAATASVGYMSYVERAQRTEAKAVLLDLTQRLERYYTDEGTYDGFEVPSGMGRLPEQTSQNQRYAIEVETSDQSFTVLASPRGSQVKDKCGELALDNVGRKRAEGAGDCW